MSSADAWHEYEDEEGSTAFQEAVAGAAAEVDDLEGTLGLAVELVDTMDEAQRKIDMEAAKQAHPAGKALPPPAPGTPEATTAVLTAADRCDNDCSAGALYRLRLREMELDFCHHHHNKHFPTMKPWGWVVVGTNPGLMEELYGGRNRHQGDDHA